MLAASMSVQCLVCPCSSCCDAWRDTDVPTLSVFGVKEVDNLSVSAAATTALSGVQELGLGFWPARDAVLWGKLFKALDVANKPGVSMWRFGCIVGEPSIPPSLVALIWLPFCCQCRESVEKSLEADSTGRFWATSHILCSLYGREHARLIWSQIQCFAGEIEAITLVAFNRAYCFYPNLKDIH